MTSPDPCRSYQLFVGIDIAATSFTASTTFGGVPRERAGTFAQTPAGFAALLEHLRSTGVPPAQTLIVMEATSSYWVALALTLHEAHYLVSVVKVGPSSQLCLVAPQEGQNRCIGCPGPGPVC